MLNIVHYNIDCMSFMSSADKFRSTCFTVMNYMMN